MKTRLSLLLLMLVVAFSTNAQRICGSNDKYVEMLKDAEFAARRAEIDAHTDHYVANPNKTRVVKTIPVVVHVVYNTATQNISDAQIQSQLAVLNADFRKLNADISLVPSVFTGLTADCEINFCLAQQDPNGNATNGIVRRQTTATSFSTNDAIKQSATGSAAWNTAKYLNIWVGNLSGGLLGYAQFPGGPASTDGVVCNYTAFGTTGTAAAPFNKGRTATHEVGHWLNLFHIWGDDGTGCTGSDQCGDTPNQADENYGCPAFPQVSCSNGPNGDMFMNYMDYTDDACMYMFTAGQKARMDALFVTGGARAGLLTSLGCQAPNPNACNAPSGLAASSVTQTSAVLSWGAAANAVSYNVQYKTNAATTWTTVSTTSTSYGLSGLTASAAYNFQVQTVCAAGTSAYSGIANFTTAAVGGGTCTNNYESNNTRTTATSIANNTDIISMIGTSGDNDYYRIVTTSAAPKLKINLTNLPLDYDVTLYRSNGSTLATSQNGSTTAEQIVYNTATTGATYYVRVYGYNGAFSNSQCYTLRASTQAANWREEMMDEAQKAQLNIFPNPVKNKVGVNYFSIGNEDVVINIYNSMGQKVASQKVNTQIGENNNYFELDNLNAGLYIMEMIDQHDRKSEKFVIEK